MNIQHIDEAYFPTVNSRTCLLSFCGQPGMVLVRDVNGFHFWMCEKCWDAFCKVPAFVVVKDRRESMGEP